MGKVHVSIRVDADLAAAVSAHGLEGESAAATYSRVLEAGVASLEAAGTAQTGEGEQGRTVDPGEGESPLYAALQAHIDSLERVNAELSGQLAIKDEQIRALSVLAGQAQELHATAVKAIEPGESDGETQGAERTRRGFWARLFG